MIRIHRANTADTATEHAAGVKPWIVERLDLARMFSVYVYRAARGLPQLGSAALCEAFASATYVSAGPARGIIDIFTSGAIWGKKATADGVQDALLSLVSGTGVTPKVKAPEARRLWSQIAWIQQRIDKVLVSLPADLWSIDQSLMKVCGGAFSAHAKALLMWLFDYDWWCTGASGIMWTAGLLAEKLDVRSCPYCNRQYTFSVVKKGTGDVIRPDFDHFCEKSVHPLLAMSFYNLVPSCTTCNSRLKHRTPFNVIDYLHPHLEGFDNDCVFQLGDSVAGADPLALIEKPETIPLSMCHNLPTTNPKRTRIENNLSEFQLEQFYQGHRDVVAELVLKHRIYTDAFVEGLRHQLPGAKLTDDVVSRILWGNYSQDDNLGKRPLSKLTRDIVRELKGDSIT